MLTSADLHGLVPAAVIPMREGGKIDFDALAGYAKWLEEQGPRALAVNVDTGEGGHMTHAERIAVLECFKASVSIPCIAGLHGPFTAQAVKEAADLKAAGADGLLVFPITAYQSAPLDPAIPVEYHREIAAVGVPLVLFQLQPSLSGVVFDEGTLRQLLNIEGVIALKEASFNALTFKNTVRIMREERPEVAVLTGNDNFMLESFLLGSDGGLLGFGAIMTREMVQMIDAYHAGNLAAAKEVGDDCQRLADAIFAPPVSKYRARLKHALALIGVFDPECANVREPLRQLNAAEIESIREVLVAVGQLPGALS
jgi:4-hydroxy-tetrahydrodipicolinate synthase